MTAEPDVVVPLVVPEFASQHVLIESYEEGTPISKVQPGLMSTIRVKQANTHAHAHARTRTRTYKTHTPPPSLPGGPAAL